MKNAEKIHGALNDLTLLKEQRVCAQAQLIRQLFARQFLPGSDFVQILPNDFLEFTFQHSHPSNPFGIIIVC